MLTLHSVVHFPNTPNQRGVIIDQKIFEGKHKWVVLWRSDDQTSCHEGQYLVESLMCDQPYKYVNEKTILESETK